MMRFLLVFLFAGIFCSSCNNPVDNITVNIDGNVIHYKATIILSDPTGAGLPALTVKITGKDSASVYDYAGLKAIKVVNGVITLGIHPDLEPTSTRDVQFNVVVSGVNYEPRVIPVTITAGQYNQTFNVSVLKTSATTVNASVKTKSMALTTGKLTLADTLVTALTTAITERTTVILAAGTEFKGTTGALIKSTPLAETIVHYNTRSADILSLFPGASFSSLNVTGQNGSTGPAFLIPAAFVNVDMTVGAQDVSSLSLAFKVSQEINPDFKPVATGQKVKAGDQLSIYSYNYTTGRWKYETTATVAADKYGKLAVTYTSLSPNGFFAGDVLQTLACKNTSFKFIGPWLEKGSQPLNLEIWSADGSMKLATKEVQVSDGTQQAITGLPALAMSYKIRTTATNEILAQGDIADPCLGEMINVTLTPPAGVINNITLKLIVNCPGKGTISPPDFDLFYKLSSSGTYQLLGTVQNGVLNTTLLKIGTTYDFRVNWGAETTTVKSRTITANDSTSGSGTGQTLSIQACGVN
jgi:hypothetical protein